MLYRNTLKQPMFLSFSNLRQKFILRDFIFFSPITVKDNVPEPYK